MRVCISAVLITLAITAAARSQNANPAPRDDVAAVLRGWEKAMGDTQTFACRLQRETKDQALGIHEDFRGFAIFAKPVNNKSDTRARLKLTRTDSKIFEEYICGGGQLYEFVPARQVVRVHKMSRPKGSSDSFLLFLLGIGVGEARKRYDIKLDDGKPQEHYHVIWFEPKLAADKADFVKARVTLYKANKMPAHISYVQANNTVLTWTFTDLQLNQALPKEALEPYLPKGWKYEPAQPDVVLPGSK